MKVFKRYSFANPLAGERVWHPSYMVADVEDMDAVSKFILTDVSSGHGSEFDVDASEKGRILFKSTNMYQTWIEYSWR